MRSQWGWGTEIDINVACKVAESELRVKDLTDTIADIGTDSKMNLMETGTCELL